MKFRTLNLWSNALQITIVIEYQCIGYKQDVYVGMANSIALCFCFLALLLSSVHKGKDVSSRQKDSITTLFRTIGQIRKVAHSAVLEMFKFNPLLFRRFGLSVSESRTTSRGMEFYVRDPAKLEEATGAVKEAKSERSKRQRELSFACYEFA